MIKEKETSIKQKILRLLEHEKTSYNIEKEYHDKVPDVINRNMAGLLQMQINVIERIIEKIKKEI